MVWRVTCFIRVITLESNRMELHAVKMGYYSLSQIRCCLVVFWGYVLSIVWSRAYRDDHTLLRCSGWRWPMGTLDAASPDTDNGPCACLSRLSCRSSPDLNRFYVASAFSPVELLRQISYNNICTLSPPVTLLVMAARLWGKWGVDVKSTCVQTS